MELMNLIRITEGRLIRKSREKEINKIKIDSREVNKNDAFLAIASGHEYIEEAVKRGASLLIVDRDVEIKKRVNIIQVKDSIEALQKIAHYQRKKYDPVVIGITGSAGKTTTKEMLFKILSTKYNVVKNEGNENNHIGVPKTLLKIDESTDIVIVEIGMNHEGEIHKLSCIATPDIGIITNVGTSHIGNLGSKKNICKEKLQIIDGMVDGILILNQDDSYLKRIEQLPHTILYKVGTNESATMVAYDTKKTEDGIEARIYIEECEYQIKALSKPYLINSLLALQTALLFDVNVKDIIEELNTFETNNNRLERIVRKDTIVLSDCYNASYESYINALEIIKNEKKAKILILGDILELGKYSKKMHKKLGRKVRKIKNCQIILVGENVKYIRRYNQTRSIWCKNNEEIKECLMVLDIENRIILIKGSHGMHLDEITEFLREYGC